MIGDGAFERQLRRGTRAVAFIGSVDGVPAATGVLLCGAQFAGLYSGSVLPRFRRRGIENAISRPAWRKDGGGATASSTRCPISTTPLETG